MVTALMNFLPVFHLQWLGHIPRGRHHLTTIIVWNSLMQELIGSVMVSSLLLPASGTLSFLLYFWLPSTYLPSNGRSITTLGPRWHELFFITLFKYFINLFYSFHYLSFPFLKGYRLKKGHIVAVLCSHLHKKKKKIYINSEFYSSGVASTSNENIFIRSFMEFRYHNETGSRSPCMRLRSDPPKMKNSNVVRSRLKILINEEINEANWMVSNSAKLDRRTKQHTQFGVSASNSSRDMARTKSGGRKKKKKNYRSELDGKQQCKIRPQGQAAHSIWSLCE